MLVIPPAQATLSQYDVPAQDPEAPPESSKKKLEYPAERTDPDSEFRPLGATPAARALGARPGAEHAE